MRSVPKTLPHLVLRPEEEFWPDLRALAEPTDSDALTPEESEILNYIKSSRLGKTVPWARREPRDEDMWLRRYAYDVPFLLALIDRLLEERTAAAREREELRQVLERSEEWRRAYQKGKYQLYAMGGDVQAAAMAHLPCNEGPLDRTFTRLIEMPRIVAERARAKRAEASAKTWHEAFLASMDGFVRLARKRDSLLEALRRYGRHHRGCDGVKHDGTDWRFVDCTCGLADALAGTGEEAPAPAAQELFAVVTILQNAQGELVPQMWLFQSRERRDERLLEIGVKVGEVLEKTGTPERFLGVWSFEVPVLDAAPDSSENNS